MELWEKIIIEWINCLEILTKPIESIKELKDGIFYIRFLALIKWDKYKNQDNIIIKFIEDEYPSFKVNKDDSAEHVYIASLLLVHFCQILSTVHNSLQDNICNNLKHETQIRVKIFLENIVPLGRDITKETMKEVIVHVEDISIATNNCKTPIKDFFNSPMVYSVRSKQIMTERIRDLRDLRCDLAMERYTNEDLRDDIQRQQNKIKALEKALHEKTIEIKELREEWMTPGTPRSSHTKEDNSQEDYYKKYIRDMENQLSKQQDEIQKLEIDRDTQTKNLFSMRRTLLDYKEKIANSEQSLQSLSSKTELKDRELVQLRIHNEELRTHIKELNKNSNIEQSFEVEELMTFPTRMSLNTSEALSTVIEIQLQEAKEESAILNAQVDSLKGKLDIVTKDYKIAMESNKDLKEKVKTLNLLQVELNNIQKKLDASNIDIANLQIAKISLVTQNKDLKNLLSFKEKELFDIEAINIALNTELNNLKDSTKNLNELLENERTNSSELNITLEQTKLLIREHLAHIQELTDERDLYKSSIQDCSINLKNILHCNDQFIEIKTDNLDNLTLHNLGKYIETMLYNCNTSCDSYKCDIEKLKATIDETSTNLSEQQLTITSLEEQSKQNLVELVNIKEDKKQKDLLLNEQNETIYKYSQEIEVLKEIKNEKIILEQNVHKLTNDLKNRELLLKSLVIQLEDLQNVKKDFKLTKEETQRNFTEYQENIKLIFEKLQQRCQISCYEFYEMSQEKEKLEYNFNCSKEELSNIQTINTRLQENLLENKEVINVLKERERVLSDELNESKRNIQELKESNKALEEQYTIIKIETNDNLESLKMENTEILFKLKDAADKNNLLQQEMSDTMTQMESKIVHINELLSEVSSLKVEKEHLSYSHKEILQAKDEEIGMKEQALLTLQVKMEKEMSEASAMEMKMKEIIINLQEVRSGQDAVLTSQEAALREKCLHIEEIQEQLDNTKKILNDKLEDATSSLYEYQTKISDLENQIDNRNRDLEKLEEIIEIINIELETTREQCKNMDTNEAEIAELCKELEHSIKHLNSAIRESCSDFDFIDQNDISQCEFTCTDNKTANILNIIKITLNELHKFQKVTLGMKELSYVNVELNKTLAEQNILIENSIKDKEESCNLKTKIREMEIIAEKRNDYLKNLIKNKESLKESLQKIFPSQNGIDVVLTLLKQKWNEALTKFQDILQIESSDRNEFKQLQVKKARVENTLSRYEEGYLKNIKFISDILWEKFLWTEQKLHDTYLCSIHEKECLDVLTNMEDQFLDERTMIDAELEKYKTLRTDIIKSEEEIESFMAAATIYDNNLKSGKIKNQEEMEKISQNQMNQLTKERNDLKNKMDAIRLRNVKLERNIDDLRTEMKKLKSTEAAPTEANLKEVQSLKDELECLKEQNRQLHEEKNNSNKIAKQELENRIKEFHATYEQKLEDIKQNMKTAYNEQITKMNKDQEKIIRDRLQAQTEVMCQKQRDELNRYKAHVGELSSQLWSVGEKLLIEQQQKQETIKRMKELEIKIKEIEPNQSVSTISRKTCRMEKQELLPENVQQGTQKTTTLITEETFERRQSVRSMQAMGNVFKTEDEEEVFDNVYLADMKRGNCLPTTDIDRLSVLQMRNNLCKPHLKSSYPAEMQFLSSTLTEEEIKAGSLIEDNFNDSLSQSLLPEQKAKKKDRSQTSYKKPGPPTPSKNGGRLSLQSNEMRSPRVLRERNVDRRTTTTPHSLKNIFFLKRQDENASGTPKSRRLSNLFRKPRS